MREDFPSETVAPGGRASPRKGAVSSESDVQQESLRTEAVHRVSDVGKLRERDTGRPALKEMLI